MKAILVHQYGGPDVLKYEMASDPKVGQTYAELCAVKAADLVKVPQEINLIDAAALPTVLTTGNTLVTKGIDAHADKRYL